MKLKNFIFGVLAFLVLVVSSHARAGLPFLSGECPNSGAVSWDGASNSKAELKKSNAIYDAFEGEYIGFEDVINSENNTCRVGNTRTRCESDDDLILSNKPDFGSFNPGNTERTFSSNGTLANGTYKKVIIENGADVRFNTGDYFIGELELKSNGSRIIASGSVRVYVNKFIMSDNSSISTPSNNPDNLVFIASGSSSEVILKPTRDTNVYAHILSENKIDLLEDIRLYGSVVTDSLVIDGDARLYSRKPVDCSDPDPEYSTSAKYQFGVQQCSSMPCDIPITTDFDLAPLVFVMPTVQTTDPDFDAPSRLVVTSDIDENSQTITIDQESLPDLRNTFSEVAMTEISYFLIEPGTVEIDGNKIVAGYVDTAQIARRQGGVNEVIVPYDRFGGEGFNNTPVVLHQLQTNNNDDAWMTSGRRHQGNQVDEVRLFIELSDTGNDEFDGFSERIAFLSSEPSNVLNANGGDIQFGHFNIVRQSGTFSSLLDGCRSSTASTSLSEVTGIIGNKQQRLGGDGGWIRRCAINGNEATFAMDEDMATRSHIPELGGYLAFEQTFEFDACDYFPSPIQTNSYANGRPASGQITMSANNNELHLANRSAISFNNVVFSGSNSGCFYGTSNTAETCLFDGSLSYHNPDEGVTFPPILPTFQVGNQSVQCGNGCSQTLNPGEYSSVTVSGNSSVITLNAGEYWIDTLTMSGNKSELRVNGLVVIHYRNLSITANGVEFNNNTGSDFTNLNLIGHGNLASPSINGNDFALKGSIYIDPISANGLLIQKGGSYFEGAITAAQIISSTNNHQIHAFAPAQCDTTPQDDYALLLTELSGLGLMCGTDLATYDISTTNNAQAVSTDVEVDLYNSSTGDSNFLNATVLDGIGSVNGSRFTTNSSGLLRLGISTSDIGQTVLNSDYQIRVRMVEDNNQEDTESYRFLPFKFSLVDGTQTPISSIDVIAGRPESVTVQVLACDDNGNVMTANNYSAASGLVALGHNVTTPASGRDGNLTYDPIFSAGESTNDLAIDESGTFTVSLSDSRFDCTGLSDCPIDGSAELKGEFSVRSRPWTFAVCPPNGTGGDSESGDGFLAAGETFRLNAKPVVWDSSLDGTIDGEPIRLRQKSQNSAFCSLATTENFYVNDTATNATVSLDFTLATPSAGRAGNMTYDGEVDNFSTTTELEFTNVSVTEVGSFHFQVESNNTFYDAIEGGIDPGARELGRFFPRFFAISDQDWDYAGSQSFNYMNQNFEEVTFEVEAFSGGTTPASVENYQHFDKTLQSQFNLYDGVQPLRLVARSFGAGTWQGTGQSIGTFSTTPSGDCGTSNLNSLCWVKADTAVGYEDGPYNLNGSATNPTDIRISAVNNVDPVEFQTDADLLDQPDLRFGRVALDSAGTTTNATLNIPLRVEFWNGERFVVNTTDSGMNAIVGESNVADNSVIWVEPGATAENLSLDDGGTVTNGESNSITVEHTTDVRQQVQIWLELDDTSNDFPWLQYQWDHSLSTEQDPSTVATFGIYRGNDRVIFRGEAGLIGQ